MDQHPLRRQTRQLDSPPNARPVAAASQEPKTHWWSRPLVTISAAAIGVGAAASIGLILARPHQHSPFSADQRQAAPMPLYYPVKLPSGFHLDAKDTKLSQGVATLVYTDGNHRVVITEQAKPSDFNYEEFYSRRLNNPLTLPSDVGVGEAGMFSANTAFASLTTAKTWIILNENNIDSTGHVVFLASEMTLDK